MGTHGLGVYAPSTIQNSKAAAWSPSKKRFVDEGKHKRYLPGPGNYEPLDFVKCQHLLSNFKNVGTPKYKPDNSQKGSSGVRTRNETPGPGQYQAPSDFGYLDMYKYSNYPRRSQSNGRTFLRTANSTTNNNPRARMRARREVEERRKSHMSQLEHRIVPPLQTQRVIGICTPDKTTNGRR